MKRSLAKMKGHKYDHIDLQGLSDKKLSHYVRNCKRKLTKTDKVGRGLIFPGPQLDMRQRYKKRWTERLERAKREVLERTILCPNTSTEKETDKKD